jgi:triosephosphate isomerase
LSKALRRPIVGGNWKMNTTIFSAVDLAEALVRRIAGTEGVDVVLFPPFPNLQAVAHVIDGSRLQLGAQDVFWEQQGAYTGEVSAPMLTAAGCAWVIVGHSERRRLLGESSAVVNRKLHAALQGDLRAVLAVGETRDERHAGRTDQVLQEQLLQSLADVGRDQLDRVVIAYEPVWAIGTGETATPEQARDAHAHVRAVLASMYGEEAADTMRIQYGGSATAENCEELMSQPGIDGALVGGASLKPDDFAAIVAYAGSVSGIRT